MNFNSSTRHILAPFRQLRQLHSTTRTLSPRILITGSLGQLGSGLAEGLRKRHGVENVICSDVVKAPQSILEKGPFIYADVLNKTLLESLIVNLNISTVIHYSALLSALAEQNVARAMELNIGGFHNVIELCHKHKLTLFTPSTIAAFGEDSPRDPTPDLTVQRPRTVYGVAKVHVELLGEYYHHKLGLDFRSCRFPGILSADTLPGGGTTDYAVEIFHEALKHGKYTCWVRPDTKLPMMYLPDVTRATMELLETPSEALSIRTYNIAAASFTAEELAEEIKRYIPELEVTYEPLEWKQKIADSWPQALDDSKARHDWGWQEEYDTARMVHTMLEALGPQYGKNVTPAVYQAECDRHVMTRTSHTG